MMSLARIAWKEGGGKPGTEAALSYGAKCAVLGPSFCQMSHMTSQPKFLYIEEGFEDVFSRSWMKKQEWIEKKKKSLMDEEPEPTSEEPQTPVKTGGQTSTKGNGKGATPGKPHGESSGEATGEATGHSSGEATGESRHRTDSSEAKAASHHDRVQEDEADGDRDPPQSRHDCEEHQ